MYDEDMKETIMWVCTRTFIFPERRVGQTTVRVVRTTKVEESPILPKPEV